MGNINYIKTNWMAKDEHGNVPAGAPPINVTNLNNIEDGIVLCANVINTLSEHYEHYIVERNIYDLFKGDLLWENNSPNTSFAETTINKDISQYKSFSILFKTYTTEDTYVEYKISYKDIKMQCATFSDEGSAERARNIIFSDNQIYISNGFQPYNPKSSENSYTIPIKIVGYKY